VLERDARRLLVARVAPDEAVGAAGGQRDGDRFGQAAVGVVGVPDPLEVLVRFAGVFAEPDPERVQPFGGGVDDGGAPVVGEPLVGAEVVLRELVRREPQLVNAAVVVEVAVQARGE
jgi:hypothetical protein